MKSNDRLETIISWLAHELPQRQAVRQQEWLAELESLPAGLPRLKFALGCFLAVWKLQPDPVARFVGWPLRFLWSIFDQKSRQVAAARQTNTIFFQQRFDGIGVSGMPGQFFKRPERLPPEVDLPPMQFNDGSEKS